MFPLNLVFDSHINWFIEFNHQYGTEGTADWQEFEKVLGRISQYMIPGIVLKKDTSREAVCTVFEKVNTGGVQLDAFELLTAIYAGQEFDLREDWRKTEVAFKGRRVLKDIRPIEVLQAISLVATQRRRAGDPSAAVSCKRRDILTLTLTDYRDNIEQVRAGFLWAADWLTGRHIYRSADVPYASQVVGLAALRAIVGPGIDTHHRSERLANWYWSGVFGELYGGTTETRLAQDIEQVPAWLDGSTSVPRTVDDAVFQEVRLLTLRTRNSAAYKGVAALLLHTHPSDWFYNVPVSGANFDKFSVDIHHVFPVAWATKQGIDPGRIDSIVNKTTLAAETVAKKAGIADSAVDAILLQHQIDPSAMRADDFDAFWSDRSRRLLDSIEKAMGKPVARLEPDSLPDEEYELDEDESDQMVMEPSFPER
jgi:hypothetical protein